MVIRYAMVIQVPLRANIAMHVGAEDVTGGVSLRSGGLQLAMAVPQR